MSILTDEDDGERQLGHPAAVLTSFDDHGDSAYNKLEQNNVEKTIDGSDPAGLGVTDLQRLSLYECKTYLRKHGIRVSGTKAECIQRIKEHDRLKDGQGEALYPRSSFSIDCTGDACRGDVVLFRQNFYNSQRDIIGSRTVAGRIVKESYGATLQQHTFSVEVLWSKGSKNLEPLSLLLIKGRNLYKFGTYRHPWESEADRLEVLGEKHERGKAARLARKLRKERRASGDVKGTKLHKKTAALSLAKRFQVAKLKRANQLTYHPHSNHSMYLSQINGQIPNQAFLQLRGLRGHRRDKYLSQINRLTNVRIESVFPKSSFSIKCTGDARKGDIVLFKQHVDAQQNKAKKKRIVAGRILKVHQCESKENRKFVIQVLWTKHSPISLRLGSDLLVRSHELYQFGTFRQPWKNEEKRSKMSTPTGKRELKKSDIDPDKNRGVKRQKVSHEEPSPSKHKSSEKEGACASATPITRARKRKATKLQNKKLKKLKHLERDPNPTNSNLNLSPNPNKTSSISSKKGSCPNLKPRHNPNPNSLQNSNPDKHMDPSLNPHQNTSVNSNATPTSGHKRKGAWLQKKKHKKSRDLEPNPNTNLNPLVLIPSPNPNMVSTTNSNMGPCLNHPIANLNKLQTPKAEPPQNLNRRKNIKRRPNNNPCKDPQPCQSLNRNALQNPKLEQPHNSNRRNNPKQRLNRNLCKDSEPCQSQNQNARQNPIPVIPQNWNSNTHTDPNPNPHPNSYAYGHHQQASSSFSFDRCMMPKPLPPSGYFTNQPPPHRRLNHNPCKDSKPLQNLNPERPQNENLNTHRDLNLNQRANSYMYGHHQQASSSFFYDRSMMPIPPPPSGHHVSNQPPTVWFGPKQGISGYGGQWGHNQATGYNNYTQRLVAQDLIAPRDVKYGQTR